MKTGFLADLFAGNGNTAWDLGRIMGFLAFLPMVAGLVFNIYKGEPIDMLALGGGIAAVYGAVAILITAKDYARTNALSQAKQDETAAAAGPQPVTVKGDLNAENIEQVDVGK